MPSNSRRSSSDKPDSRESLGARVIAGVREAGSEPPDLPDKLNAAAVAAAREAVREAAADVARDLAEANSRLDRGLAERCRAIAGLVELQHELDSGLIGRRERALRGVQEALSHLRGVGTVNALLEKTAHELCRSCDFDRAILSRVDGSQLMVEAVCFDGRADWADDIVRRWRQETPELNHLLLETELLRRRTAALVSDPRNDRRAFKPLITATGTVAYVAAPILPEGRVIGFLHADRYPDRPPVDEVDRDVLWSFAEGFGYALQRTILLERLASQGKHVRQQMMSLEALINEFGRAPIEIAPVSRDLSDVFGTAASMFVAPETRIETVLTDRELEVLGLMANGASNGEIADRLVIAEGTVKSHVKHILRKLRAANRAEAVSRYVQLTTSAARE